jgi:hypothetical protein
MSSEALAGLVMATGLWVIAAAAVFGAPTKPPSEIWVSTASDKVRSHPTLVRAADPLITGSIGC